LTGFPSRYLRVTRSIASEPGYDSDAVRSFRFRYPRAVERGGSGLGSPGKFAELGAAILCRAGVAGFRGARPHRAARRLSLGARTRRQARRAAKRRSPCGRWGLTAQRGPSKGGHHAINTEMRLAPKRSSGGSLRAEHGNSVPRRGSSDMRDPQDPIKMIRMVGRRRRDRRLGLRQK